MYRQQHSGLIINILLISLISLFVLGLGIFIQNFNPTPNQAKAGFDTEMFQQQNTTQQSRSPTFSSSKSKSRSQKSTKSSSNSNNNTAGRTQSSSQNIPKKSSSSRSPELDSAGKPITSGSDSTEVSITIEPYEED